MLHCIMYVHVTLVINVSFNIDILVHELLRKDHVLLYINLNHKVQGSVESFKFVGPKFLGLPLFCLVIYL